MRRLALAIRTSASDTSHYLVDADLYRDIVLCSYFDGCVYNVCCGAL